MKKILFGILLISGGVVSAQRYLKESFQVQVTQNVTYATNVDFLKNTNIVSQALSNTVKAGTEKQTLMGLLMQGQPIPAKYYNPADTSTILKVSDLKMDVYEPVSDSMTERPVVVYLHTGNFLPPQVNGSLAGDKTDSSAAEICRRFAARGFVAISINYRLGWNPLAPGPTGVVERRATLLNAVYRAIHDTKEAVRYIKMDARTSNTFGVDTNEVILFGEGSGGYVALAYATLDDQTETEIQKFVFPGTTDSSYVQPALVGDYMGYGGLLNLYYDQGVSADIDMVVNAGGALADTSWLEAGDAPMISFHAVRDPFAPFDEGTVIVPTTNEQVVDVQGANVFMMKANQLGNNQAFTNFTYNDPYTAIAQSRYGNTYSYFLQSQPTITLNTDIDGLYPIIRPLAAQRLDNEGSPWQWWASGLSIPSPHPATEAKTFIDTIMGYAVPRIMVGLQLEGYTKIGMEESSLVSSMLGMFPNPAQNVLNIRIADADIKLISATIMNVNGQVIKTADLKNTQAIDLSDLKAGAYLLQVETSEGPALRKLMKN